MSEPRLIDQSADPLPRRPAAARGRAPSGAPGHHGDVFSDPYEWLRDKQDADVIAYLEAENAYTEARTGHLSGLTEAVFDEIKARTQETDLSVPTLHDSPIRRRRARPLVLRAHRRGLGVPDLLPHPGRRADRTPRPTSRGAIAGEQILLDANVAAEGEEFFSLGAFTFSVRAAAGVRDRVAGDERFLLRIVDLTTGELLADEIADIAYGVAWAGESHLFYTRADAAWRPYVVLRHRLGTDPATDAEVLTEPDERFWVGVGSSRDEDWIVLGVGSKLTSEYWLLPAADPEGEPAAGGPAPPGRGVRRRAGRGPAADRAQRRRRGLRARRGPAGRHQPRAVGPVLPHTARASGSSACPRMPVTRSSRCAGTG